MVPAFSGAGGCPRFWSFSLPLRSGSPSRRLPARRYARLSRPLTRTSPCEDWSLTTLKEKLVKIGAKVVSHGRYIAFQMAEVAISRHLFADILRLIAELRPPPDPAPA
jgi:Transposase DDE domain group 1